MEENISELEDILKTNLSILNGTKEICELTSLDTDDSIEVYNAAIACVDNQIAIVTGLVQENSADEIMQSVNKIDELRKDYLQKRNSLFSGKRVVGDKPKFGVESDELLRLKNTDQMFLQAQLVWEYNYPILMIVPEFKQHRGSLPKVYDSNVLVNQINGPDNSMYV